MPNFLDVAAGVVTVPKDGYGTQTALNVGPGSLYYKAGSTVSSGSNDGTLTSGSSLSLTGPTSFVAAGQGARLVVSDPQYDEAAWWASSVGQAGGVAGLDTNGLLTGGQRPEFTKCFYAADPKYGVKANGKTVTDAVITAATNQLSSTSAAFTNADQGKLCVVVGAGTPVSGTTSGATGVSAISSLAVNALAAAIPPGGVVIDDGAGHTQQFVTSGALAGATSVPFLGKVVGGLTSALSTGGAVTTLPVAPLSFAIASGTVTLVSIGTGGTFNAQTFTTTGAAIGATSIPVTSLTPNFTYPESTVVFGNPITATPTFNFPSGSTVRTNIPALSTTISSVNGGVATLAANAGTTVSGAECFYASDDTAALQSLLTAGGVIVLPVGHIGVSAALTSGVDVSLTGQGVHELYGGVTAANDANWPTIAPYLTGSVIVQCAANADIVQFTAQGRAQTLRNLGLRFAGRFANTGYGINNAHPGGGLGNIGGRFENVKVFGIDGNHYGLLSDSPELMTWQQVRFYGGGGVWFKTNASVPGPPGNNTCNDYYSCTFVAGVGQAALIDCSAAPSSVGFDYCLFENFETAVRVPNPVMANVTAPTNGGAQNCLQTFNPTKMALLGFVNPSMEADTTAGFITWPNGPGCYRTSDPNPANPSAFSGGVSQAVPTGTPASGTAYQNLAGKPLLSLQEFILQPLATASVSTTLNGATSSGATTFVVTSATGLAIGQGIQVGSVASNDLEFAIISSVSGTTIGVTLPGSFGLEIAHANGAAVAVGAAVVYAETSPSTTFPSRRVARFGLAVGTNHQHVSCSFPLAASYYYRMTWANAGRMWTDYVGSFG